MIALRLEFLLPSNAGLVDRDELFQGCKVMPDNTANRHTHILRHRVALADVVCGERERCARSASVFVRAIPSPSPQSIRILVAFEGIGCWSFSFVYGDFSTIGVVRQDVLFLKGTRRTTRDP